VGWTFTQKSKGLSIKEFFEKEFNGTSGKVLDCASRLHEAYLAYEISPGEVIGIVCALQYRPYDYYNFGYKDMDENMGPYFYNCPKRILELLTPTTSKYAKEWRRRCWRNIKRKEKINETDQTKT